MELTRRTFGKLIAAAGVTGYGGIVHLARWAAPARVVRAACTRIFPGKVLALNSQKTGEPGRWSG